MWVSATNETVGVTATNPESAKWEAGATWLEQQKQSSSANGLLRLSCVGGCVAFTDGLLDVLEETLPGTLIWLSAAHRFGAQMSTAAHDRIRMAASLRQTANIRYFNDTLSRRPCEGDS